MLSEPQPRPTLKKSWQQLFTRSSAVAPSSNPSVISRPNTKFQTEVQSPQLSSQTLLARPYDNPINFGLPSPFTLSTYPYDSTITSLGFPRSIDPTFPRTGEGLREFICEEPEHFEDPCYEPDPIALIGPVSESLNNFQMDRHCSATDKGFERPRGLKNLSASSEVIKPSDRKSVV